jgi:hypothetical protein
LSSNEAKQEDPLSDIVPVEEEEEQDGPIVRSAFQKAVLDEASRRLVPFYAEAQEQSAYRSRGLAAQSEFTIHISKPTGKTITNAFGEQEDVIEWEEKTIHREKISQQQSKTILDKRREIQNTKDPKKREEMGWKLNQYLAYCYFRMTPQEYERTTFEEMGPILEGCEERTARGLPYSPKTSDGPSTASANLGGVS